jgi:demethylmenaquinone methyltransferase/2-methoxy-6-polyprenyl-1,4-benzoquinol methylase
MENRPKNISTCDDETNFGFQRVRKNEHAGLVSNLFQSVADSYDVMNDLMSGGLHRLWKQSLIDRINPQPGMRLVDVAGGTGDIIFRFLKQLEDLSNNDIKANQTIICDPNLAMLRVAKKKAIDKGYLHGIDFIQAPAEALPLSDRSTDVCTISFGLRNVTDREAGLAEIFRVLDFGGRIICLEFSPAVEPFLAPLYDTYSTQVLPWLGKHVAGNKGAYEYLVESIRCFPEPSVLTEEMENAGFGNIHCQMMSGGIVAIHSGWRL